MGRSAVEYFTCLKELGRLVVEYEGPVIPLTLNDLSRTEETSQESGVPASPTCLL